MCRGDVYLNAMGKIEWAMWANEQALASGLSEYINFTWSCLMSSMNKANNHVSLLHEQFDQNAILLHEIVGFFFSCRHQFNDGVNAPYYHLIQLNKSF